MVEIRLVVLQDSQSSGLRLQVTEPTIMTHHDPYSGMPLWTAFLTSKSSLQQGVVHVDATRKRVLLKEIRPYLFSSKYDLHYHQRENGNFEIQFLDLGGS